MGLEVDMKFAGYEEVGGVDPKKLLEDNMWWSIWSNVWLSNYSFCI